MVATTLEPTQDNNEATSLHDVNFASLLWDKTLLNNMILLQCQLKIPSSASWNHCIHLLLHLFLSHPFSLSHIMTRGRIQRGARSFSHCGNSSLGIHQSFLRDERASREVSMAY